MLSPNLPARKAFCRATSGSCCLHTRSFGTSIKHKTLRSFLDSDKTAASTPPSAYQYSAQLTEPEPIEFKRVREEAIARNPREAQKMISPLQGAFMSHMVSSQQAITALELGCYIGYSALWLARGLCKQGEAAHLWTCERDTHVAEIARANVGSAGYADLISVIGQPASRVLEDWDMQRKLDLVFIDANKSGYQQYYDLILDRELLSDRGQIIVDNVLFHGQVHALPTLDTKEAASSDDKPSNRRSRIAQTLANFNIHVAGDPRTSQVLLPVFDGLLLIQRRT
ncbi:S-adenosyl-L-methionine-dependent methyltransferase [Martensiomyces pterosporus]|nr:S-adenosyl-L-methionine-dependent methyltransferase [Martensiomyces pterosporus]